MVLPQGSTDEQVGGEMRGKKWIAPTCIASAMLVGDIYRTRARRAQRAAADRVQWLAVAEATAERPSEPIELAVVIPAFNEAASIEAVLATVPRTVCSLNTQIIVVDDGSSDESGKLAAGRGAILARHSRNLGQAGALRTGFAVAQELGSVVTVTMDADGQHDPADLPALVRPVIEGRADYVQGSRFLGVYDDAGSARDLGIRIFTRLINLLSGTTITDCTNGFRAIRTTEVARLRLIEGRFNASEILIEASARGLRILEVPVHIRRRENGNSRKPRGLGYPIAYLTSIVRSWARSRRHCAS